jgi:trimethylamine--corrinoid protein Co-methyltransferase
MAAVEMCEVVAGGAEAFKRAPFAVNYVNVTTGLIANEEALQKCIFLAEKGLPMLYIPLNAAGVNSPATTAGCMASMNAGTLLGVVLAQLVRPGTPVGVPGWNGGPYNLKTMVGNYVLADEQGVATEMGKHFGLPVFGLGGSTDSKVLDQQCGLEVSISLMTALIHGANIVHDVGFMDSGLQASLQLQVIASDFIGFLRAATAGVLVDDETLALEVIEELGPQGDYLGHDHTLRHYKDPYYSELADKGVYAKWLANGGTTMEERAGAKVSRILESHKAEPPPTNVIEELDAILVRESERFGSQRIV